MRTDEHLRSATIKIFSLGRSGSARPTSCESADEWEQYWAWLIQEELATRTGPEDRAASSTGIFHG